MKYFKILTFILCVSMFTTSNLYAQKNKTADLENKNFQKTSVTEIPKKVKETALAYRGFEIKEVFVGAEKSTSKIYKVVLSKKNRSITVLVDRKGRIVKELE